MATIHVHMKTGPQNGQRLVIDSPGATFGRDPTHPIIIDGPYASRQHGELRYEEPHWLIVNASPNGTTVNGRKIGRKGKVLADRDVVGIAGQPMFEVHIESAAAAPGEAAGSATATTTPRTSKRTRLWIGIAIYFVVMMLAYVFFSTISERPKDSLREAPELTRTDIEAEILKPLPQVIPDARTTSQHLEEANRQFVRLDASASARYNAYHNYRLALAYSGKPMLDRGLDQRRYQTVQADLIDEVYRRYTDAYQRLRSRDLRNAEKAFRDLLNVYPDPHSRIYKNIEQHRAYISSLLKKRRSWE